VDPEEPPNKLDPLDMIEADPAPFWDSTSGEDDPNKLEDAAVTKGQCAGSRHPDVPPSDFEQLLVLQDVANSDPLPDVGACFDVGA